MTLARDRSDQVAPCPFCRSGNVRVITYSAHGTAHRVICQADDCYAQGPLSRDPDRAIEKWNAERSL